MPETDWPHMYTWQIDFNILRSFRGLPSNIKMSADLFSTREPVVWLMPRALAELEVADLIASSADSSAI